MITTEQTDAGIGVAVRFESPEARRLVLSLATITHAVALVVLSVLAVTGLMSWPEGFSGGERMVMMFAAFVLAFAIARALSAAVSDRRFCLRALTDRRLSIELTRDAVAQGAARYGRSEKIAFTSEPHRKSRVEERTERAAGHMIPEIYRLAYEVKLQHGEHFVVLAELSDEAGANAIARRLQTADDQVTRGIYADRDRPFDRRQLPE